MAFFLLEGCASRPLPVLSDINFDLSGKIGVRWQADRFSARFRWLQAGDTYQIELWGPLGQGRTVLEGDSRYMRISNAGGELIDAGAAEAVMLRQLGWYLPLEAMPRWIEGAPMEGPAVTGLSTSPEGRVTGFTQLDWQLTFDRFQEERPTRVTAERPDYWIRVIL